MEIKTVSIVTSQCIGPYNFPGEVRSHRLSLKIRETIEAQKRHWKQQRLPLLADHWFVMPGGIEFCIYQRILNNFVQSTFWGKVDRVEIDYFATRDTLLERVSSEYQPFQTSRARGMTLEEVKKSLYVMG